MHIKALQSQRGGTGIVLSGGGGQKKSAQVYSTVKEKRIYCLKRFLFSSSKDWRGGAMSPYGFAYELCNYHLIPFLLNAEKLNPLV